MRRMIIPFVLLVGVLTLTASGLADPGGKGKGKAQGKNKFSFSLTTTVRRCDGTESWATLTETRTYRVHDNGDGTFRLRRADKGTFVTVAGKSPGNCLANKSKHGQMVRANVTGRFGGYLEGTIMGGVFNKKATCPVSACFTADFLKAFFGAGAVFSCDGATNSTDCKFNYNYTAPSSGGNGRLVVRHWQDRGKGSGTTLVEHFHGDIASS